MRKLITLSVLTAIFLLLCWGFIHYKRTRTISHQTTPVKAVDQQNEEEEEDGILESQKQEFSMTKDVSLGYIPKYRLVNAYEDLMRSGRRSGASSRTAALTWTERGPNADAVGPSNGNGRPGGGIASGRILAVWVDLSDATNKTVWIGGIDGGLWKTTNITSSPATWTLVNDFFGNLGISSICQDPTNNNIMYFGTGEKSFNADAVRGGGIWKSTDHGVTWSLLPSTTGFWNISKLICDASGNLYAATLGNSAGLQRSTDGGTTWTNISPSGLNLRIAEMKLSSNGKLHVICGYFNTAAASAGYRFTATPSTVTSATWTTATTGFPAPQYNCELAANGNTLYALTSNSSFQTPQIYKSTDGGANWAATATSPPAAGGNNDLSSGQGWYCLALAVDPANANNVICGGLNCYKSINGGSTWSQVSVWVSGISGTVTNYIHADQHIAVWNGNQILVGSDGGIFYSANSGTNFTDRNSGLRIKQFYSCAIHPSTTNYFLGGAQDNGCHQFTTAGLSSTSEVTGGDGAFVHIDQDEPQYQFGSYVHADYRRSTDGGNTWTSVTYSTTDGQFINPTDYDDQNNKMYAGSSAGQYVRWDNPQTGNTFTPVTVAAFGAGSVTHVMVSPNTSNRVFFGTSGGKIVKVDNANTNTPAAADVTGSSMSASTVSCVALGTDDNNLIATFSNYGASHVWVSTTGGGSGGWTNISGNLPDIPVRWAMFYPLDNTKAILATEMGIYETANINGASTVWTQNASFPIVRTDMLQYRKADGTVAAATHGRGLWTATIPLTVPYISFASSFISRQETTASTTGCRNYKDYTVNMTIDAAPAGDANVLLNVSAGTAVQGVDYDFTTNGNFASPSETLTFLNGSATPQPVTIRIYDDAEVESTESFTLSYTLSGTTDAQQGPSNQTYTFTITDNDSAPVPAFNGTFTIGTYNANLGAGAGDPFESDLQKDKVQVIFSAAELQSAGIATACNLNNMTIRVVTKGSTKAYSGFTIQMANTAATNLSTGFVGAAFTQVYTGNYSSVVGDNTFTFSTPFAWDGTSNVLVQFCFDNGAAVADGAADVVEGNSAPLGAGVRASTYSDGSGVAAGCSLNAAFIGDFRIDASFGAASGNPVATLLNTSKTESFGPNNDLYFYSASGQILARIRNLLGFDYGCTQVIVDRGGNGTSAFWNNTPANYLMNKTFHVIPTTNNGSGQYQITLYYTATEKAAWEAATGQSWNNIQLIKVPSQISNYAPSTPNPDGAGVVQIVTPIFGTFGSDYTLTYTFSSGFSGFGAGIPGLGTLPVTLINFAGQLDNSKSVLLGWSTSAEQNMRNFDIEKSTDAVNFYTIGSVNAIGNSFSKHDYSFRDIQLNESNYYRLRINDMDGHNKLSNVVLIRCSTVGQKVYVLNNPFDSYISLRLAKMPEQKIRIELFDLAGARVYYKESSPSDHIKLDLSQVHLSKGTYTLKTTLDGYSYSDKVVKQ